MLKFCTRFILLTISISLLSNNCVNAQLSNINFSTLNVDQLSNEQVERIIKEIDSHGISDDNAISLAKAKGLSSTEAKKLKIRIRTQNSKTSTTKNYHSPKTVTYSNQTLSKNKSLPDYTKDNNSNHYSSLKKKNKISNLNETYGYKLFNSKNLTFEPAINIPTPSNYTLGIGDIVIINIWGNSQANYKLTVDINGKIDIPYIGPIYVYGKQFNSVVKIIKKRLLSIYNDMHGNNPNTHAEISLGQLRSIKINVVGEVNTPGTYSLPATATAYNALYLSGGPNANGSFRNIQIIRNGKSIKTIDVYNFLLTGDLKDNINLKENDIIYVSSYKGKVRLKGAFKRTGLFETKQRTTLDEIIKLSGGFTDEAFQKNLKIIRKTDTDLKVITLKFNKYKKFVLKDGDEITAGNILNRYENRVVIAGHVFRPGEYELTKGMKVSDLIKKAEGIKEGTFTNRAIITRINKNDVLQNISFNLKDVLNGKTDITLQKDDYISIKSIKGLEEKEYITINGLVQKPGIFPYAEDINLGDIVFLADGFKNFADTQEIEVARKLSNNEGENYTDKLEHIFIFKLNRQLKLSDDDKKFKIKPFDVVNIRKAPGFREEGSVLLKGEVMHSGSYSIKNRGERISDLIKRSGGLTPRAYAEGATLIRKVKVNNAKMHQMEEFKKHDTSAIFNFYKNQQVGIRLDKILNKPGNKDDIVLLPGDEFFIPRELQTVKISGYVMNPISMTYKAGKRAKFFIKHAGGFSLRPKRSGIYVMNANGISKTTHNFILFKLYPKVKPGSEIIVPQRPLLKMTTASWIGIGSAISGLTISIISLANILK